MSVVIMFLVRKLFYDISFYYTTILVLSYVHSCNEVKLVLLSQTHKGSEEATMFECLDVVAEEKSAKEENNGHQKDIVVLENVFAITVLTNVAPQPSRRAVPLWVKPVGAKIGGVGQVNFSQAVST